MPKPDPETNTLLRRLPKVDEVLRGLPAEGPLGAAPRWAVVAAVRDEIEALRHRLRTAPPGAAAVDAGGDAPTDEPTIGHAES